MSSWRHCQSQTVIVFYKIVIIVHVCSLIIPSLVKRVSGVNNIKYHEPRYTPLIAIITYCDTFVCLSTSTAMSLKSFFCSVQLPEKLICTDNRKTFGEFQTGNWYPPPAAILEPVFDRSFLNTLKQVDWFSHSVYFKNRNDKIINVVYKSFNGKSDDQQRT